MIIALRGACRGPAPRAARAGALSTLTFTGCLIGCLAASFDADAASIAIHQDIITSSITRRLFTDNGRRMLTGSIASCSYAYLERPAVTLKDGRLYLRMRLAAQAGISLGGACKGAGDAFFTTVSGQPYVTGDSIGLRDFRMEEGREMYKGLLEPLLRRQVPALLGANLKDEMAKTVQNHAPDLRMTLSQFQLQEASARDGYLTVRFDFSLFANEAKATP